MPRVGLVGCGFIGTVHSWALWALRKSGRLDVRFDAVCDADPERAAALARPQGADVCIDVASLVERVDVVYVCTPTGMHLPVVELSAAAGRAVFCEKPLGRNLAEAGRVAEVLASVPHRVGLVMRAAPVMRALASAIRDDAFGRTMAVHLRDDQYLPVQGQYASTWRSSVGTAGGGTLIEHSIHDVDLFRYFLGDPVDVAGRTASFFGHPGVEDLAAVTLAYADGSVATLLSVWHQVLSRPSTRRLEVFCENAHLWTDDDNTGPLHVETASAAEVRECPLPTWAADLPVPTETRGALVQYATQSESFLGAVVAGEPPPGPDASDALAAHVIVDAAYRSASDGGAPIRL